ncbi:MAG: DUF3368 domain-containing protein [Thermomicrobiales bacterium]
MTEPIVYTDATTLIGLARIDRLDLLAVFPRPVLVTRHVWSEVAGDPARAGVPVLFDAREQGLLAVIDDGDPNAFPYLGAGESSALSAAMERHAAVIIDEQETRALIARGPEIRARLAYVTGLIGLLQVAKQRKHIEAVRPILDRLVSEGFQISRRLYDESLRRAGELQ